MPDLRKEFDSAFVQRVSSTRHLAWRTIGLLVQSAELLGAAQVAKSWLTKARKLGLGLADPENVKPKSTRSSVSVALIGRIRRPELHAIQMSRGTAEIVMYYEELRRRELAHLSIEALVIEPRWKDLFTTQELDGARKALPAALVSKLEEPPHEEKKTTGVWLSEHIIRSLRPESEQQRCRRVAEEALRAGQASEVEPIPWIRSHLSDCADCALQHGSLAEAYAEFDRRFFSNYELLATQLIQIVPTDELLERLREEYFVPVEEDEDDFLSVEERRGIQIEGLLDPLAARFLALAAYLGRRMSRFAGTFILGSQAFSWWEEVLKGQGPPSVAQYVGEWSDDLRQIALLSLSVKKVWLDSEFGERLPLPEAYQGELTSTDGLTVRHTFTEPQYWLDYDVVPSPPAGIWAWGMMVEALDSASHQLANLVPKPASTDADRKLDTIMASLSEITERSRSQSRVGAEERLLALMGETYGLLPTEVRFSLIGGEQMFGNPEHADPSHMVSAFTKAFELCVGIELVKPLQEFLARDGIRDFPNPPGHKQQEQLRAWGQANSRWTMGGLNRALDVQGAIMRRFCEGKGLEFDKIRSVLKSMTQLRNEAVHEAKTTRAQAEKIRFDILGDGGAFQALLRREDRR